MKVFKLTIHIAVFVFLLLFSGPLVSVAYGQSERGIPESKIEELREVLEGLDDTDSTIQKRRICKKIVRGGESLIKMYSDSPDRFRVLGIIFETQKALFTMRQSDEYRKGLVDTAKLLMDAPDELADVRVEADMMLLQMELASSESKPQAASIGIARFADRYRGSPAEAKSLIMASTAAFDLGDSILLDTFRKVLSKRFSHDPLVSAFMRQRFASGSEVYFRGLFKRADGKEMSFPTGQLYILCFWSRETPLLKEKAAEIASLQKRHKGQMKVFSFNLDQLRDCGDSVLKRMKLDWIAMQLPGGTENPTWKSVGGSNMFAAPVIGPHGLAVVSPSGRKTVSLNSRYYNSLESPQLEAVLRSLCIGEFLVIDSPVPDKTTLPQDMLGKIQACFTLPPMRYQLTPEEEFTNYEKAEKLCGEALIKHSGAPDIWVVYNHRIISLLGMWRLSGDLEFLERAVRSAKAVSAMDLPVGQSTVPQFCIATKAMAGDDANIEEVLTKFIEACGGKDAVGSAYAAALMLAIDAHSPEQYIKYRDILLTEYANDPATWAVSSFLLDQYCAARLFEKALPGNGSSLQEVPEAGRLFKGSFTTLKGDKVEYPASAGGKMAAAVFMEKPADSTSAKLHKDVVDFMAGTASGRPLKDIELIGVFRSDDPNSTAKTMSKNKWDFNGACVSKSNWAVLCRQFGIVNADRTPNIILTRPDGSIMFAMSGASVEKERKDQLIERIETALRDFDLALADKALAEEDYQEYAARLSTSFPLKNRRRSRFEPEWKATSDHRRKLVWGYMQANDFKHALKIANEQIEALSPKHSSRGDHIKWCRTCYGHLHDMCVRIALLRETGAKSQADEALAMIDFPECSKGKGVDALWADVASSIKGRRERWRHLSDPKRHLAEHEMNMRSGLQNLYGFRIEADLMMRAKIHEKLGNSAAAKADMRNANVRAWPFKVRQFDPDLLNHASGLRRKLAQKHLEARQWKRALELVNRNIDIHEAEPLRCTSMCKICSGQVQSFGFRVTTLESLGRKKEAQVSRAMAEHAQCPPGGQLESYKCFPVNRMYGGGTGINRLNFIDTVMTGENPYANKIDRQYRVEFAADLSIRARVLEKLGETEKAEVDRRRAVALAYPYGPDAAWNTDEEELPLRYVDLPGVVSDDGKP